MRGTARQAIVEVLLALAIATTLVTSGVAAFVMRGRDSSSDAARHVEAGGPPPGASELADRTPLLDDVGVATQYGDAVYRVEAQSCLDTRSGTAFAIDPHHLVTNRHVVALDQHPTLFSRRGRSIKGRVINASSKPDLAVIAVDDALPSTLSFADPAGLTPGDHLTVLGYPVPAEAFTITPGSVSAFVPDAGGARAAVLTDAKVDHGNSGGPAVTGRGSVAGIVTWLVSSRGAAPSDDRRIGVVLSYDAVKAEIDRALAGAGKADALNSDACKALINGLQDDYSRAVPAAPTTVPSPRHATAPSSSVVPPTAPVTTSTVPCPSGKPAASVSEAQETPHSAPGELHPSSWDVDASGTVTNMTSAAVRVISVRVTVTADPSRQILASPAKNDLAPGESTTWTANVTSVSASSQPTVAAETGSWNWSANQFARCPAG